MLFKLKVDSEINLVFLTEKLADTIFQLVDSDREHLNKWLPWPTYTKSVKDSRLFIKNSIVAFAEGRSMTCAIEYRGDIVGVVSYNKILRPLKKVEIGYWLSSKYQGKGIITRSVDYLTRYALDEMGMEKVEIAAASENQPSRSVCERLGFNLEGIIKNSENLHGRLVDLAIYGFYK
ncbi:ribosomal-protein-L7/L12-serine acetyltransferase [Propionigenium maris DSM 9537]|uniref:Ribosomal-protein-L7/L12-serine acetyltransferase n=1 Tax=Propionigenium maris DSM 9537 TaxID=1123000 RepID=A0A9W6GJ73_9FUSO|nr:GNAT family N-acetyltransferase [Propionigenium maris]GLI54960.1 ribosomal-protein-L7/L12-serine acetyltransferase [Propionigenium maris DSM 9537]